MLCVSGGKTGVTINQLMIFWTGSTHVKFSEEDRKILELKFCEKGRLPSASTCANILYLPKEKDFAIFQNNMERAIKEGQGFSNC